MEEFDLHLTQTLENNFELCESGFQYQFESDTVSTHGAPSHYQNSTFTGDWHNFRRANMPDVQANINDHTLDLSSHEECNSCGNRYTKVDILATRIRIRPLYRKHRKVECSSCKCSIEERSIDAHYETCGDGRYCSCCKQFFPKISADNFHNHSMQCSVVKSNCTKCGMVFNTASSKANHQKKCTIQPSSNISPSIDLAGPSTTCNPPPLVSRPSVTIPSPPNPSIPTNPPPIQDVNISTESAIDGRFKIIKLLTNNLSWDYEGALVEEKHRIKELVKIHLRYHKAIKFYMSVKLKVSKEIETQASSADFRASATIILLSTDVDSVLDAQIARITSKVDEYTRNGSGWVTQEITDVHLHITKYNPLKGSSATLEVPKWIADKRCTVNILNNDSKCFLWCCLAERFKHLEKNHLNRTKTWAKYLDQVDIEGEEWPMELQNIPKFEAKNNFLINVFAYDVDYEVIENGTVDGYLQETPHIFPIYSSKCTDDTATVVNMIYIQDKNGWGHYIRINNMSPLAKSSSNKNGTYVCVRCLHAFKNEDNLKKHRNDCIQFKLQSTAFPKDDYLSHKAYRKSVESPLYLSVDFECNLEKNKNNFNPGQSTNIVSKHVPCGYAIQVVTDVDAYKCETIVYRGKDCVQHFIKTVNNLRHQFDPLFRLKTPMKMTTDQVRAHNTATICYICKESMTKGKKMDKVRDHCHYTGKYEGAAHTQCNIQRQVDREHMNVICHNMTRYDGHIFIAELCKQETRLWNVSVIPKTLDTYSAITTRNLKFLDLYQHLSHSMEEMVDNLTAKGTTFDQLHYVKKLIQDKYNFGDTTRKIKLLSRKGVYPYSYMDSEEKFDETTLPTRDSFHNDLTDDPINDEDWAHIHEIWEEFELETLGDLHDLYVQSDVVLLADVFQKYRKIALSTYGLEPLNFYSLPGLSFEACLKLTKVKLQYLKDTDMYMFCERGIRGGVSCISQRYAKANHEGLPNYDPAVDRSHLLFVDSNNLYGMAMSEKMPVGNFRWEKDENVELIDEEWVKRFAENGDEGCFLEVDLEIPERIHDETSDYPLCPEKIEVNEGMLSVFSQFVRKLMGQSSVFASKKLTCNLFNKDKYIVHIRNLKFYLERGVVLKKVHRVLMFSQTNWIQEYIAKNTELRRKCDPKDKFGKDFYKMLNNAFFGKTMENVRGRVKVVLVDSALKHQWQTSKPGFKRFTIINNNLVGVELVKPTIKLDRPIYVGFSILELSKLHMYNFHYNVVKKNWPGDKSTLCLTDTDSFLYHFKVNDIHQEIKDKGLADNFDFSNYPKTHDLYSLQNEGKLGKFKDECSGEVIEEFIGLRSKMYSVKLATGKQKKAAAGVKKSVANKVLKHDLYRQSLLNHGFLRAFYPGGVGSDDPENVRFNVCHTQGGEMVENCDGGVDGVHSDCYRMHPNLLVNQTSIRAYGHNLRTINQTRVGLSSYDDKRWVLQNHSTRPHGHFRNTTNNE